MSIPSGRQPWRSRRSKAVWAIALSVAALGALGVRSRGGRPPGFRDALRQFNRRWFNPGALKLAGRSPWPLARLEHLGRRSGALHATPVLAWPVAGGFVVPMPYGKDVDWARNLLHAGAGVLQSGGVRYRVGNPRIVPTDGPGADAPRGLRRLASACGLRHVMRVDVLPALAGEGPLPT